MIMTIKCMNQSLLSHSGRTDWMMMTRPRFGVSCFWFSFYIISQFNSAQFSRSAMSNSLRPHGLQYAGLPCPSPTPGAYSNSCPLSWWCHPTISQALVNCLHLFCFAPTFLFPFSKAKASKAIYWLKMLKII